jgi:DNA-binding transcriptional LysR family regulator
VRLRVYATQAYLDRRGVPESPEDLHNHRLISQHLDAPQVTAGLSLVQALMTRPIQSFLKVNNYFGVLQGVLNDLGLGVLPDYVTRDTRGLIRVFPDIESAEVPVFLAYPEELRQSKRIQAFRDFVQAEIKLDRKRDRASEIA